MLALFALSHEHDANPELRSYQEPINTEKREELLVGLSVGVMRVYRYFEQHRKSAARRTAQKNKAPCGARPQSLDAMSFVRVPQRRNTKNVAARQTFTEASRAAVCRNHQSQVLQCNITRSRSWIDT